MLNLIVSLLILPLMATDTAKQVRFTPKDLPYAYDALAPQVSEETLRFHHDKHYVGYVNKLNELIVDTPYAEQPLEDIVVSADGAIFNNGRGGSGTLNQQSAIVGVMLRRGLKRWSCPP